MKRNDSNNVSRQSSNSFPSPDGSKDSGICTTPEIAVLNDADFEERVKRWERRRTIVLVPHFLLRPPKEEEDLKVPVPKHSTNSVQAMFEGPDLQTTSSTEEVHEDSDMVSDFTSITAERKKNIEDEHPDGECISKALSLISAPDKPISQFERNTRVLRWLHGVHGCSTTTSTHC